MNTNSLRRTPLLVLFAISASLPATVFAQESPTNPPSQEVAAKTSVKPGINKGFLDPELKVDDWIAKFEVESREVFRARDAVLEASGVKPGDEVADIGAGTGIYSRLFSKAVGANGKVFAVDISPKFIEHLGAQIKSTASKNIETVLCNDKSTLLPPRSVDLVFVCDTYHHFEYPAETLASIRRALRPGGTLVVIDFDRIEGKSRDWLLGHVRADKATFRGEIEKAGFRLVEEIDIDGFEENYFLKFEKPK
jgi:SAM-dependent methyltransferase